MISMVVSQSRVLVAMHQSMISASLGHLLMVVGGTEAITKTGGEEGLAIRRLTPYMWVMFLTWCAFVAKGKDTELLIATSGYYVIFVRAMIT